jgi:hypothetical protein
MTPVGTSAVLEETTVKSVETREERAVVPRIWSFEISNGLVLAVCRSRIDELLAYRMLRTLHRLPIVPDEEFAGPMLGRVILRLRID